jgi:hypothetical protein
MSKVESIRLALTFTSSLQQHVALTNHEQGAHPPIASFAQRHILCPRSITATKLRDRIKTTFRKGTD